MKKLINVVLSISVLIQTTASAAITTSTGGSIFAAPDPVPVTIGATNNIFGNITISNTGTDLYKKCYKNGKVSSPEQNMVLTSKTQLLDTMMAGVTNHVCGDEIEIGHIIKNQSTTSGTTVQNMVKRTTKITDTVDFVSLDPTSEDYFIGYYSSNVGLATAYHIKRSQSFNANMDRVIKYSLKQVNFKDMFFNYIKEYCSINGAPPILLMDAPTTFNWFGNPSQRITDYTGALSLDPGVCHSDSNIDDFISSNLLAAVGTSGARFNVNFGDGYDGNINHMFKDDGYVLNMPVANYSLVGNYIIPFFTSYMYNNNIERGVVITDDLVKIDVKQWTSGKWWNKKQHMAETTHIGTKSYNLILNSIISPLEENSISNDWSNLGYALVTFPNIFPSLSKAYTAVTPDGHVMSHSISTNGEITNDIGFDQYIHHQKSMGFNWFIFLGMVALMGVGGFFGFAYFSIFYSSYGIAAGLTGGWGLIDASIMNWAINQGYFYKHNYSGGTPAIPGYGSLVQDLIASQIDGVNLTKYTSGGTSAPSAASTMSGRMTPMGLGAIDDKVNSGSTKIGSLSFISLAIKNMDQTTMVPVSNYNDLITHSKDKMSPSLFDTQYDNYLNQSAFVYRASDIGVYWTDAMGPPAGAIGYGWLRNSIKDGMSLKTSCPAVFCAKDKVRLIMGREWPGDHI